MLPAVITPEPPLPASTIEMLAEGGAALGFIGDTIVQL
jgi:hypothetical protein